MNNKLPKLRKFYGVRYDLPYQKEELISSIEVEKVLWNMLYYVSEVKTAAWETFKLFGISEKNFKEMWFRFRSYIRQAYNFWEIAVKVNYKSAPLLFYYSFLNLVKAYFLLKNKLPPDSKIKHGIAYPKNEYSKDWKEKHIIISKKDDSLFNIYYKDSFNIDPPNKLKVLDLFAYTTDISYEYRKCKIGEVLIIPVIHRIFVDETEKKLWTVVAIPKEINFEKMQSYFPLFTTYFELCEITKFFLFELNFSFNFKKLEWISYDFYQLKKEIAIEEKGSVKKCIEECLDVFHKVFNKSLVPNYLPTEISFYISFPIPDKNGNFVFFNEELAIYAIMYFLSDLVRYQPDCLDEILESEVMWLFKSFIEECSIKFLRILTSKITNPSRILVVKRF